MMQEGERGGRPVQPRLREGPKPDVAKSHPAPLNLVLIQTQHCPRGTSIFSDRALPCRPRAPTYPLGPELNRVSPCPPSYRISKLSVNADPPPLPPSGAHPIVYQKPFYAPASYPLLKNRSSIITSPLIRGLSEWVSGDGPVAPGRAPCLAGVKATHPLVGDKTLKPGPASLGQRGRPRPVYRPPNSYFRDNSAIPPPQLTRGGGRVTSMLN